MRGQRGNGLDVGALWRALFPSKGSSSRATILLGLILVVGPTLLVWALSRHFSLQVPIINLDLGVVYVAAVLVARRRQTLALFLAVAAVALVLAIQMFVGVGLIYLDDPALVKEYLSFVKFWPWRLIGLWMAVAVAGLFFLYLVLQPIQFGRARLWPVLLAMVLAITADLTTRTPLGYRLFGGNVATSSAVRATKIAYVWLTNPGFTAHPHPGDSELAAVNRLSPRPNRIVSIAVESYGFAAADPAYNAYILKPLTRRLAGVYDVQIGQHPYKGATLAGEIRELCALRITGTPTRERAERIAPGCLPHQLRAAGYATTAMHGNSRFFYNRSEVYKALGFTDTRFIETLVLAGLPICKTWAFEGICDSAMLKLTMEISASAPKSFVHLITLDTHFPVGSRKTGDDVCGPGSAVKDSGLCLYRNLMHDAIGHIATSVCDAKTRPDVIYVFGDHAPPFAEGSKRNFFDRGHIPFITLTLRDGAAACKP